MDVDRLLNFERRTGVKNSDIEDFERKAQEVQNAIKGLMDGSLRPEDVKIEGIETEEDKLKKEKEREEKRRKYLEKEAELKRQRKLEEKTRWWSGAEVYHPKEYNEDGTLVVSPNSTGVVDENKRSLEANILLNRYTMDYSKWDSWTPTDEVSLNEERARAEAEERKRNAEFEKNNPEFCAQFVQDMEARKKSTQQKQDNADNLRVKGNKYFKSRDYTRALELYTEALRDAPFDPKLLLNIAQAQIKLKEYEDALEFLKRTLYLDERNVKALSRQCFVLMERGDSEGALVSINQALAIEPQNADLLAQHREVSIVEGERKAEAAAQRWKQESQSLTEPVVSTGSGSTPSTLSQSEAFAAIDNIASQLSNLSLTDDSKLDSMRTLSSFLVDVTTAISVTDSMPGNLSSESLAVLRAHFRSCGALMSSVATLKELWSAKVKSLLCGSSNISEAGASERVSVFLHLLRLLAQMVIQERSAKQVLLDQQLISTTLRDVAGSLGHEVVLLRGQATDKIRLEQCYAVLQATLAVFRVLGMDDSNSKARLFIWRDKASQAAMYHLLGGLTTSDSNAAVDHGAAGVVTEILSFVRTLFEETQGRQSFAAVVGEDSGLGVLFLCALGTTVHTTLFGANNAGKSSSSSQRSAWMDDLVPILLGASQIDLLRIHFATPLPIGSSNNKDSTLTTAHVLVQALQRWLTTSATSGVRKGDYDILGERHHASNVLAVLLNASIAASATSNDTVSDVRQCLVDAGAVPLVLNSSVFQATIVVDSEDEDHVLLRSRLAGLLSRLAPLPTVASLFLTSSTATPFAHYSALCRRLQSLLNHLNGVRTSQNSNIQRWQQDEAQHLLRCLASIPMHPNSSGPSIQVSAQQLCQIACDTGVIAALLSLFPRPREDCGEFTAVSVTQMPSPAAFGWLLQSNTSSSAVVATSSSKQATSAPPPSAEDWARVTQILGNAARCLLHFSDVVCSAKVIFLQKDLLGIEKLICAMATVTDIRVRRNISIVLAKGIKTLGSTSTTVRERITQLRGLQMMLQLQDQL